MFHQHKEDRHKKMKVNVFFKQNETGQEVSPVLSIPSRPTDRAGFFSFIISLA